jgi:hypothetical protein
MSDKQRKPLRVKLLLPKNTECSNPVAPTAGPCPNSQVQRSRILALLDEMEEEEESSEADVLSPEGSDEEKDLTDNNSLPKSIKGAGTNELLSF